MFSNCHEQTIKLSHIFRRCSHTQTAHIFHTELLQHSWNLYSLYYVWKLPEAFKHSLKFEPTFITHDQKLQYSPLLLHAGEHTTPMPKHMRLQFHELLLNSKVLNHKCTDTIAANISSIPKHIELLHWLSHTSTQHPFVMRNVEWVSSTTLWPQPNHWNQWGHPAGDLKPWGLRGWCCL